MKQLILIIALFFANWALAQNKKPVYDKALAEKLGADEYGMKNYMFVILKTGPRDSIVKDKKVRDSLFAGHMANIGRLAKEGQLVIAGPFGKNDKSYRGLFILNVKTKEEAIALLSTDPTIKEKIFECDITPWYGSAAISEYLKVHDKISKVKN